MPIPKNVPLKKIFKPRNRQEPKDRITLWMPEELLIALDLYAQELTDERGQPEKVTRPQAINVLLYSARAVQNHLPRAREIIKTKQESTSGKGAPGSN